MPARIQARARGGVDRFDAGQAIEREQHVVAGAQRREGMARCRSRDTVCPVGGGAAHDRRDFVFALRVERLRGLQLTEPDQLDHMLAINRYSLASPRNLLCAQAWNAEAPQALDS